MPTVEEIKAPTPREVDALIAEYAERQKVAVAAGTAAQVAQRSADELKQRLVTMVETFGRRHTEKSKRLEGIHNKATTTTAVCTTTDPIAIEKLHEYVAKQDLVELEGKLFQKQITYTLVASPDKVLASVSLAARIRTKLTGLVKSCFKITTKAPSLKIEVPEVKSATSKAA
jgi:hypothetical protein